MNDSSKYTAFDYLVSALHKWYGEDRANDMSKLKLMKLLFFTVAISANRSEEGLLGTFDNFMALPYGHVESDIYRQMDSSAYYTFNENSLVVKLGAELGQINLDINIKNSIDKAVLRLQAANINLINYKAFDLVDISHKWQSWKTMYSLARKNGRYSMKIPKEMIMSELKTFVL
jgi:uncharacterized phage-associated protein